MLVIKSKFTSSSKKDNKRCFKSWRQPDIMVHAFNPSTWDAEGQNYVR